MADVIRTWQADAVPNSTNQIPSRHFLTGNELLEMISGQLSVPHAEQTKLKLVHFILENGSADLLQNLKERAQKGLGKRKEWSPGDITSHK